MLNNWTPEVASLIATLKRHGFTIVKGHNGEYGFKLNAATGGMKQFIADLTACDESHLYIKCPKTSRERWIYLVLGNEPGELASDWTVPNGLADAEDPMNAAIDEHYKRWDGRKQPKIRAADQYPEIYGPAAIAEKEAAYAKRQAEQEAHIRQLTEGSVK